MPVHGTIVDPSRPGSTRHEVLSTTAPPLPLALVGAPQTKLVVTTLDDVADATDGLLSLREAVDGANADPGLDTITFADDLRGGSLRIQGGTFTISEDLVIDGDPDNGGPGGIVFDDNRAIANQPLMAIDADFDLQLQDLTFRDLISVQPLIVGGNEVAIERVSIRDTVGDHGTMFSDAKALTITDSEIRGNDFTIGITPNWGPVSTEITVVRSEIVNNFNVLGPILSGRKLTITDSTVFGNSVEDQGTILGGDWIGIYGSTFSGNSTFPPFITGVEADTIKLVGTTVADNRTGAALAGADIFVENSTLVNNYGGGYYIGTGRAGAIAGERVSVLDSTITGNSAENAIDGVGGILARDLDISNSIVAGNLQSGTGAVYYNPVFTEEPDVPPSAADIRILPGGSLTSNGTNIIGETDIAGLAPGDRTGITADQVFATTTAKPGTGLGEPILSGVLADNGGPTRTVALIDDPANPAVDAADPASAPATDQRGFARDATPDIGAFELGASPLPPFPADGLVVTTLDDVVDATDGLLSLREAVDGANADPGLDTITFADDLRGGTIDLALGNLVLTDDAVIDGDTQNGGASGIAITAASADVAPGNQLFAVRDADVTFADVTLQGGSVRGLGTLLPEAFALDIDGGDVILERALLTQNDSSLVPDAGQGGYFAPPGIGVVDGSLTLLASEMRGSYSVFGDSTAGTFFTARNSDITFLDSRVADSHVGDFLIATGGSLRILSSTFDNNHTMQSFIDASDINIHIEDSAFVQNSGGAFGGRLLNIFNSMSTGADRVNIVNSTFADNTAGDTDIIDISGGATLTNSSITGNSNTESYGFTFTSSDEGPLILQNSIVVGNFVGAGREINVANLQSNGANVLGESAVPGSQPGDRLGVDAREVFAETDFFRPFLFEPEPPVFFGIAAENGGPTQTVALLDDAANPAVGAADPDDAPALDQRGFARDAAPDIGAFELGAGAPTPPPSAPPLPDLAEKVALADADILGVPRNFTTLTGGDAEISFVDEFAAFQSSLGVYLVGPDETILDPQWVFERVEHSAPSDLASAAARPGGGPSSPGDAVRLSDLFDPADLGPGVEFGLFLVADGAARNPLVVFDGGTLAFRSGDDPARVTDTAPELLHVVEFGVENGVERLVSGDIMHTVDAGSANPLSNTLNPGRAGQATSGTLDGLFTVAFEDQPLAASDRDFNDVIVAIDLLDAGEDVFVTATPADAASIGAGAALETLLAPAEAV